MNSVASSGSAHHGGRRGRPYPWLQAATRTDLIDRRAGRRPRAGLGWAARLVSSSLTNRLGQAIHAAGPPVQAVLRGHQCDLVFHRAGTAAGQAGAQLPRQPGYRDVLRGGQRGEAVDAGLPGPVGQPGEQLGAQSPALPVVHDGDGDLGGLRVVGVRM